MKGRVRPSPLEITRSSGEGRKDFNESREDVIGALSKCSSWENGDHIHSVSWWEAQHPGGKNGVSCDSSRLQGRAQGL